MKNLCFTYKNKTLEIVNKFKYLGIVFTVGGSFRSIAWSSIERYG